MIKPKSLAGSTKEELFKGLLESIDQKFGASSANRGIHLFLSGMAILMKMSKNRDKNFSEMVEIQTPFLL